jgi:hypothetical protein
MGKGMVGLFMRDCRLVGGGDEDGDEYLAEEVI